MPARPRNTLTLDLRSASELRSAHRLALSTGLGILILLAGTVGYLLLDEGKRSVIECLFMTVITVTTIGYGEVVPLDTDAKRLFTMALALAGVANLAFFTSAIFAWIVEIESNPTRRRRSMEKSIAALSGHFVICGMGRAGSRIAQELAAKNASFVAIDIDEIRIDEHIHRINGDASDEDSLIAAGVASCAGVFAVTGDDSKNLMITLAARELSSTCRIVARAGDERNAKRLAKSGADSTICPDIAAGAKLARAMLTPHAHGFIDVLSLGGDASLVEIVAGPNEAGKTIAETLASRPKLSPMALHRGGFWTVAPPLDLVLAEGDVLILLATALEPFPDR